MSCITFIKGNSIIHRLDPRAKIVIGVLCSVFIALVSALSVLWSGLLCAFLVVTIARLPIRAVIKRLLGLNLFMLLLWLVLPITTPGSIICIIGPADITQEGVLLATSITLKGNAIVLIYTALLSTIEVASLGHAFTHLRVPKKLSHLFLFTVRYVDVLHHEYKRLRTAMKVRCFHPHANMHTYRTFGYLVGMLLTKSLDRSERVVAAMKCRGFRGKFYMFDHFSLKPYDMAFIAISVVVFLSLIWMEWSWITSS